MQDDWKVNRRLTVNLGLRWDYFGHWATGHQGVVPFPIFTRGAGSSFAEQVASGSMKVRGDGYFANNTPNGFAPRIGFAWDVFGDGSTSIRAGYEIFYSRVANLSYGTNGSNTNPPALGSPFVSIQQPGATFGYQLGSAGGYYFPPPPGLLFQIGPTGGIVGSRVFVGGVDPNPRQPTTNDWTFGMQQRRLGGNFVAEADYLEHIAPTCTMSLSELSVIVSSALFGIVDEVWKSWLDYRKRRANWRWIDSDCSGRTLRRTNPCGLWHWLLAFHIERPIDG